MEYSDNEMYHYNRLIRLSRYARMSLNLDFYQSGASDSSLKYVVWYNASVKYTFYVEVLNSHG
jgi:hypothetical protein